MSLKAIYDNQEDIPAEYIALFAEKNGKYEIQVEGVKTSGDVERLQTSLQRERDEHKETKAKLRAYDWVGDLDEDGVTALRDKIEDLEASAGEGGGPSEEEIEAMVEKRVERALRKPNKTIEELSQINQQHLNAIQLHEAAANQRKIRDHVENVLGGKDAPQIVKGAREDIIPFAERIMTVNERGEVVTKDGVGFEPGVNFGEVLGDLKAEGKRSHWFPASQGAGAAGSDGSSVPGGTNPFAKDTFSMTEIGKLVSADKTRALAFAKAAGRTDLIQSLKLDQ